MSKTRKSRRRRTAPQTFRDCLSQFLTPAVWKQAHHRRGVVRTGTRWTVQHLVLVALFSTWGCGDSQEERFDAARVSAIAYLPKRRRPGRTVAGYQKALGGCPVAVLRAVVAGVRQRIADVFGERLEVDGFVPIGCDGSRLECPRSRELEACLGQAGKTGSAPTVWVTALVHLRHGLLWGWRLGRGTASERHHLLHLIPLLPTRTLLVADAGYVGYEVARALLGSRKSFLIRMSSAVNLYVDRVVPMERFREGVVYYWPNKIAAQGLPALRLRLIRLRARRVKNDVWLLTNVLDAERLSVKQAGQFYRWRWENEGLFRTDKRTLAKVKLVSRTVRLVHREAESSLLAVQLLLAQGAAALRPASGTGEPAVSSARQVLREIRREMRAAQARRMRTGFRERLAQATRERRSRTSAKSSRVWPRRTPHTAPKPPQLLRLTKSQKARIERLESDSV